MLVALSWLTISVMAEINPSHTLPKNHTGLFVSAILYFVIPLLSVIMQHVVFTIGKPVRFFIALTAYHFFLISAVYWASAVSHRDYQSLLFQLILVFIAAALLQIPEFRISRNKKQIYKTTCYFVMIIFTIFLFWLMLMGYAIVTRSEPRWIESTAYNFVGAFISLVMLMCAVALHHRTYQVFESTGNSIVWNDDDISDHFTQAEKSVLLTYVHNPESCTCNTLTGIIEPEETGQCRVCIEKGWSAINCKNFRKVKKYTLAIKKYLELLGVGTIVQVSEKYHLIKQYGWKLRYFDDVLFVKSRNK